MNRIKYGHGQSAENESDKDHNHNNNNNNNNNNSNNNNNKEDGSDSTAKDRVNVQENTLTPIPTASTKPTVVSNYTSPWALLHDPTKINDVHGLAAKLSELGITEISEMPYIDPDVVQTLSTFLKPVPAKRFLAEMER